jgi:16S rRNA (guanine1207-N2)-methyltransferase
LDDRQGSGRGAALDGECTDGAPDANIVLSDGFDGLNETGFDLILCNPPYQADFATPKRFIEKGFNRLNIGGRMLMVTKRELWYRKKLTAIFGGVAVHRVAGYVVFEAIRRRMSYANSPGLQPTGQRHDTEDRASARRR